MQKKFPKSNKKETMKTDNLEIELRPLEYRITRLEKELSEAKNRKAAIIDEIEKNLINDIFSEAKN